MSSKLSVNPLTLVPAEPLPFDQAQRLFFEELRHDGKPDRLTSIVGHLHRRRIIGITFLYQSGTTKSIGFTATDEHQTIQMMNREQIVSFVVGKSADKIRNLEVCLSPVTSMNGTDWLLIHSFRLISIKVPYREYARNLSLRVPTMEIVL